MGAPLRIALVCPLLPRLSEAFVMAQATGLLERGHAVDILARESGAGAKQHGDLARWKLLERTRYWGRRRPGAAPGRVGEWLALVREGGLADGGLRGSLACALFEGRRAGELLALARGLRPGAPPDVIHAHFGPAGLAVARLKRRGLAAPPLVTTFHGHDVNVLPRRKRPDHYAPLFRHGDVFTGATDFVVGRLLALGAPPERCVKLPNGVRLESFPFAPRRPPADGPTTILTVARLSEVKGHAYGIRAVARLVEAGERVRWVIAGEGPERARLEALVDELGLRGVVVLLGEQTREELQQLYADAHLLLQPSIVARDGAEEGQGLVLLEGQASGLPVVATRVGGIPESVDEGRSARLVPPEDAAALAAALSELLRQPEAWEPMGRAGRRFVEHHFAEAAVLDRLEQLYTELLQGGRRRRPTRSEPQASEAR